MGCLVVAIAAVLVGAPPGSGTDIPLRLDKGQEFVYRGLYTDSTNRPGSTRKMAVESYVFILNVSPNGTDAAFLTVQHPPQFGGVDVPPKARLDVGRMDGLGRIKFSRNAVEPRIPPDGPPNLETRSFIELPLSGVSGGLTWEAAVDGENPTTWTVMGLDRNQPCGDCLKLRGLQQSEGWKKQGAAAWRREETVWLKLKGGYAIRIERTCENRDANGDLVLTSTLVMDLETFNPLTVPPSEVAARLAEIQQMQRFKTDFEELLERPLDRRGYANLLASMQTHINNRTRTPYRAAILTLQRNVEAAKNGDLPPEPSAIVTLTRPATDLGQPAPDLNLVNPLGGESLRLARLRGEPVILLLFKPTSPTVSHLLKYADEAQTKYAGKAQVLALAVASDAAAIVQLRSQYHGKLPILDGRDAAVRFAGDATPRIVILDATGTVISITCGWGGEYPIFFDKQMDRLLQR